MSFDIYGNDLARGHCEVHPYVHEEYPCSVCMMDNRRKQEEKRQMREMQAEQERQYYDDMAKEAAIQEIAVDIGLCLS